MDRKGMNTELGLFNHSNTSLIKSVLDSWHRTFVVVYAGIIIASNKDKKLI
jgi:hypothetical protein